MVNKLFHQSTSLVRPVRWWPGMEIGQKMLARINGRTLLLGVLLSAGFMTFMALVQFSTPDLAGNDGYYHIKFANLMRTEGLRPEFPWLPLTILNSREYYDHHFLFHVALIPFTLGDLRMGAKLASVLFASLAFLSIWWVLYKQRVPYAALWALGLLAVSEAFIYRMSLVRTQSLSLAVLALGLHWMLTQKHDRLLPLAFLYVWLYDAFPLILILVVIYTVSVWLLERRLNLRPLIFTVLGIGLGLVINPYFPFNIVFIYRHVLPKLSATTAVSVGSEWYPYKTSQLLENSPLALVAFLAGALALGLSERRMDIRTATVFVTSIVFGLMLFHSRRFIEYFPPFSLLFVALAWHPLLAVREGREAMGEGFASLAHPRMMLGTWISSIKRWIPAGLLMLVLIPGMWNTFNYSKSSLERSKPYQRYAQAAAWLEDNTPVGSSIFQTDWDDFPRLFFYNTHNTYLVGLDPTYLQLYDAELYDLWVDISQGDIERPSENIFSQFGVEYVMTDLHHKDFLRRAEDDPGLREVYRDEEAAIYQIIAPN